MSWFTKKNTKNTTTKVAGVQQISHTEWLARRAEQTRPQRAKAATFDATIIPSYQCR